MNEQTVHELRRVLEVMEIEPRVGLREEESKVRSGEGGSGEEEGKVREGMGIGNAGND